MRIHALILVTLITAEAIAQSTSMVTTNHLVNTPCPEGSEDSYSLPDLYPVNGNISTSLAILDNLLITRTFSNQIDTYIRENNTWEYSETFFITTSPGSSGFIQPIGESNLLLMQTSGSEVITIEKTGNTIEIYESSELQGIVCEQCSGIETSYFSNQLIVTNGNLGFWSEWVWDTGIWTMISDHQLPSPSDHLRISFNPWLQRVAVSQIFETSSSVITSAQLEIYTKTSPTTWTIEDSVNLAGGEACDGFLPTINVEVPDVYITSFPDLFILKTYPRGHRQLKVTFENSEWQLESIQGRVGYNEKTFESKGISRISNYEEWIYDADPQNGFVLEAKIYGEFIGRSDDHFFSAFRDPYTNQYTVISRPINLPPALDCDGDLISDACDSDCNSNSIPDSCELINNPTLDCDENGILDSCEINSAMKSKWTYDSQTPFFGSWSASEKWIAINGVGANSNTIELLKLNQFGELEEEFLVPYLPDYNSGTIKLGPNYIAYPSNTPLKQSVYGLESEGDVLTLSSHELELDLGTIPNFSHIHRWIISSALQNKIVTLVEYYVFTGNTTSIVSETWVLEYENGTWLRSATLPLETINYSDDNLLISGNLFYEWDGSSYQYQQTVPYTPGIVYRSGNQVFVMDTSSNEINAIVDNGNFWEQSYSVQVADSAQILTSFGDYLIVSEGSHSRNATVFSTLNSSLSPIRSLVFPYKRFPGFNNYDFTSIGTGFLYRNLEEDYFSTINWCTDFNPLSKRYDAFTINEVSNSLDCNQNLILDSCEIATSPELDCDQNGVLDTCQSLTTDCNNNGIPDSCETDCDGNGFIDECEISEGLALDCNNNQIPDYCDFTSGFSIDCNNNGFLDDCEITQGFANDCDANGQIDLCQIAAGDPDCNLNQIPDICDIANGEPDNNTNSIPDSCEGPTSGVQFQRGDVNEDLQVNIGDAVTTLDFLFTGGTITCAQTADLNNDALINIADAISLLGYLFSNGPTPDDPFGFCGIDTEVGNLTCDSYSGCP